MDCQWSIFVIFLSISVMYVAGGPVDTSSELCNYSTLVCKNSTNSRCLQVSDICDGIHNCASGRDEFDCEMKGYVLRSDFITSREMQDGVIIKDVSKRVCAKFCTDENRFTCLGFQHNLKNNHCRLLDVKLTRAETKENIQNLWMTYWNSEANFKNSDENPSIEKFNKIAEISGDNSTNLNHERRKREILTNEVSKSTIASCGKRFTQFDPPQSTLTNRLGRVIGGVDAPAGAYPWQVAIKRKGESNPWCGGVIIESRFILTVAHCVDHFHRDGREFVVVVGEHDLQVEGSNKQIFEVDNFVTHPNFEKTKNGDDIALIKLDGKGITFNDVVQPICLPSSEKVYEPGTVCSVTGWGMKKPNDEGSLAKVLQVASVRLISGDVCIKPEIYGNYLSSNRFPDSMVCAGYLEGKIDACTGDSGGPLACPIDGHFQLLGLVSWGDDQPRGCARKDKPGVYTKTLLYLDWIRTWMEKL